MCRFGVLISVLLALFSSRLVRASDGPSGPSGKQANGPASLAATNSASEGGQEFDFEADLTNHVHAVVRQLTVNPNANPHFTMLILGSLLCLGILAFAKSLPAIAEFLSRRRQISRIEPANSSVEQAYAEFAKNFRSGPVVAPRVKKGPHMLPVNQHQLPATNQVGSFGGRDLLAGRQDACPTVRSVSPEAPEPEETSCSESKTDFLVEAPEKIAAAQRRVAEITNTSDPIAQQKILCALHAEIGSLKASSSFPEVLPFWQMASALEALLKQLCDKPANVTSSRVKSVADAVDLLQCLCKPEVKADLATNPPIRLLSVDDDPICRHAVSFALQQALQPPDLAADGHTALAMARQHTYDGFFLDIELLDMDGFELCGKIRQTAANRATPVVFVTRHSDFDSRSKSELCGGGSLIGKPFLIFEITVKALTLVLRSRLQQGKSAKTEEIMTVGA